MATRSAMKTAYHVKDGAKSMYIIDAHAAVRNHPKEWSFTPWDAKGETTIEPIPEGWQDFKPSERITLAVKLGAKRAALTAAKADELIEAEVEKRAAAEAEATA